MSDSESLHPLILRTLSWFASSSSSNSSRSGNATNSNSTTGNWHISNWWHNSTFDYEEFNEDVRNVTTNLEDTLHPASDVDINGVLTSAAFNAVVFVALMLTYEILRRIFPHVYASRQSRAADFEARKNRVREKGEDGNETAPATTAATTAVHNLPDIYQTNTPLDWVMPVFGISWRQVREAGGLDAYFFLRYIRMCFRITSVSAFWGMLILFPIFANGNNGASGWYHFSMANTQQGSSIGIWAPTAFMYLFSGFVFFMIKTELKHYVELRLDFLGKGDGSQDPQHHYSLMVEQIPTELRSEKALFDYFEHLFPGKVHSANVILNLPDLETLSRKKLKVTRRLEKSIAHFEATSKRPSHVVGQPRMILCGIELTPMMEVLKPRKKDINMDFDDDELVAKGERVDCINYYTHQLKRLNKKLFILQKNKRDIVEFGNQSLRATSWFSRVTEYAEYFMDDPNVEDSDDDDRSVSPSSLRSGSHDLRHNNDFVLPREDVPDRQNSLIMKPIMTHDNNLSSKENGQRVISDTVPNPASPSYGTLDESISSSSIKSKKSRRFFRSLRNSKKKLRTIESDFSAKNEPLIDPFASTLSNETPVPPSILKNKTAAPNIYNSTPEEDFQHGLCLGDAKTAKKVSKFAGRFGLDFGAYAMKLAHRIVYKSMDDEKNNVMSRTGFVTFLDLGSVTCIASAPLTHKPNTLEVTVAPEARDIMWQNCHYTSNLRKRREANANGFLALGALLWSIPLAFIQGVSSAENVSQLPGMDWILDYDNGSLKLFINSYLPVVALLGLILLLPIIFQWVATFYEKRKTQSDVQQSLVGRYFYYQLANIYISVTAGSLLKSAADIIARPSAGLEILGNSLPTVVGYFIALIITKILAGLPMVILRLGALSRYLLLRLITREQYLTQMELDQVHRAEPCLYGWEYPTQLLVIVICFTYACISPFILIFGALYFIGALMVYKKQVLYVYTPSYESGGSLFPLVCDRTIIGLICGQLTFMGYSIIRGGHHQVSSTGLNVFYSKAARFLTNIYSTAPGTSTSLIFIFLDYEIFSCTLRRSFEPSNP